MTVDPQDPVANRIRAFVRAEPDPLLIATLEGGYVMLNERQPEEITPCCVLLPLRVVGSINELDPGERREEVDAPGRTPQLDDLVRLKEVFLGQSQGAEAEPIQGLDNSSRVFGRCFDPDVQIFRIARVSVKSDSIPTDHEVADAAIV